MDLRLFDIFMSGKNIERLDREEYEKAWVMHGKTFLDLCGEHEIPWALWDLGNPTALRSKRYHEAKENAVA